MERAHLHEDRQTLSFMCPGCKGPHSIRVNISGAWGWNGSLENPTFTPSVLVRTRYGESGRANDVCHSFVKEGNIEFLNDCTHALAGQTVPLLEWDNKWN